MASTGGGIKEFYAHDLVYKFDERKRIALGVVSESYEASDSDESSALQKGQLVVIWNNSVRRQICRQSKVSLLSRSVIPGDIVRRLEEGRETQRGYCKAAREVATVQVVESDRIVDHVASSRLCFVKPFEIGDAVFLNGKFGRVQGVDQMLRMQSKCGSVVEVRTSINYQIKDYWNHSVSGGYFEPGYPGQTVVCTPMQLKDPKWLKKSKAMKRKMEIGQTFTIQSIDICMVEVWWLLANGHTEYAELKEDEIKNLRILPYSDHLMIGDRYLLKLKPSDLLLKKKEWMRKKSLALQMAPSASGHHLVGGDMPNGTSLACNGTTDVTMRNADDEEEEWECEWMTENDDESTDNNVGEIRQHRFAAKVKTRRRRYSPKQNKFSSGSVVAVEVLCTDSKATIVWQDGTEEKDISTTELYYSVSLDDHEFFPGEWVVPNNTTEAFEKFGVIQAVNFVERTAEILWFNCSDPSQPPERLNVSEHSVYDLRKHHKYVFRPGSTVKGKCQPDDRIGRVIDSCPEGYVIVQWLNNTKENCWPQDIEIIPENEDLDIPEDMMSEDDDDLSSGTFSWETESVESFDGDVTDDINLQNMASKVDFIRSRIGYLREAFRHNNVNKNFHFLKDLLYVYDNSGYLDKFLGTSFFSLESKHFQALLMETKKKAKSMGIELKGRLFSSKENLTVPPGNNKLKTAEKDNLQKIISLESKVNAQLESATKEVNGDTCPPPTSPDSCPELNDKCHENLCLELLLMLKMRMDLVYAEIVSRMGGRQALTVLTNCAEEATATTTTLNPSGSIPHTEKFATLPDFDQLPKSPSPVKPSESEETITNNDDNGTNHDQSTTTSKDEAFCVLEQAPDTHRYYSSKLEPKEQQKFLVTLQKEYKLLKESLPPGVWVRVYENRTDLLSVMIRGPAKTPYEDGLFLFDVQLPADYPKNPPHVHYISYISEVLNPNLYVEGKVCVSLLGTWMGRGSEVWGPNSTLLQLIVSIQGLILVAEPYYNEAGYERQTHTQQGYENSRTYNEFVLLKLVQSTTELLNAYPSVFRAEIMDHFGTNGEKLCQRIEGYCREDAAKPDFPLLPVSKGLKLSLEGALASFRATLRRVLETSTEGQRQ